MSLTDLDNKGYWASIEQGRSNETYWSKLALEEIPVEQPDFWTRGMRGFADIAPFFIGGLFDAKIFGLGVLASIVTRAKSGGLDISGRRIGYDVPVLIGDHHIKLGSGNGTLDIEILRSIKWWQRGIDVNFRLCPRLPGEYDVCCISKEGEDKERFKKVVASRITPKEIMRGILFSNRVPANTKELSIAVERAYFDNTTYTHNLDITGFAIGITSA